MALEQVAQAHYTRQATLVRDATDVVLQLWTSLGPDGYERELTRVAGLVAAGQLAAARQGADYVTAAALAQGVDVGGVPDVVARAFAGQTADGMPLEQVLRAPLNRVKAMQAAGATADEAVRSGTATLTRLVSNEVTLAGNNATAVAVTANPGLDGYVRMLSRPSCGRCAILAGKWFKWNAGFDRHPGCDCVHVPAADAASVDGLAANPRAYFDSLSKADQDRYFGKAEAEAIRGGADMGRTVNATGSAKSGLASGSFSTKPTGGVGRALRSAEDLDRDRAVALLRDRGYLTPPDAPVRSAGFRFDPADVPRTGSTDPLPGSDDWLATLTDDEVDALRRYTGKGSDLSADTINHKLGGGDPLDSAQARAVALIDSAIAKAGGAIRTDVPLYRGVERWIPPGPRIGLSDADIIDMIADDVEKDYPVGSVVKLNQSWQPLGRDRPGSGGFASTSTDVTPALDASVNREAPGLIFEIAPTPGAPLQAVTKYDDEFEVLLGRDEKFRVVAVHRRVEFWDSGGDSRFRTVVQVERVR